MYVDVKETIWRRYYIDDNDKDEVIKALKNNNTSKIIDLAFDTKLLVDSSEELPIENNDGQPTIEVLYDKGTGRHEVIWDNSNQRS